MFHRLGLLVCLVLLGAMPRLVLAQGEPDRPQAPYINELKQRNADYGPGCNGIGISIPPAVDMPDEITSRWVASHSACIPGLRLIMVCLGDIVDEDRIVGCTVQVADGQAAGTIGCDQFTLIVPDARFKPDPMLSDILSQGTNKAAQSCTESGGFSLGAAISVAFLIPATESATDTAILIDVDGSEVPAFLVPAGQLNPVATDS